eukprot:jgi/Galph1/3834/GphlegSOOS_G2481.1
MHSEQEFSQYPYHLNANDSWETSDSMGKNSDMEPSRKEQPNASHKDADYEVSNKTDNCRNKDDDHFLEDSEDTDDQIPEGFDGQALESFQDELKFNKNAILAATVQETTQDVLAYNDPSPNDDLYGPRIERNCPQPRVEATREMVVREMQQKRFFGQNPGRACLVFIGAIVTLASPVHGFPYIIIPTQLIATFMILLHIRLLLVWLFGRDGGAANIYHPSQEEYDKVCDEFSLTDTTPTHPSERTEDFAQRVISFWSNTILSPPTWAVILALLETGVSAQLVALAVLLGGFTAVGLTTLLGHACVKFGVPLPIICHSGFSFELIHIPLNIKLLVGCLWYAISSWVGGEALAAAVASIVPFSNPFLVRAGSLGVFWILQLFMVWFYTGNKSPKETMLHFKNYWEPKKAVPSFLYRNVEYLFVALIMSCVAVSRLGNATLLNIIRESYLRITVPKNLKFGILLPLVNAFASLWSFQILSAPNLSKRLPSQESHLRCTFRGIVPSAVLMALMSPVVVSAVILSFGGYASRILLSSPSILIAAAGYAFGSVPIKALLLFLLAAISYTSNMRACMETLSQIVRLRFVRRIGSLRWSTTIGIVFALLCPWFVLSLRPELLSRIWVPFMGAIAGPLTGVLLCEYFIIRRMRLKFYDLYDPYGCYQYFAYENPVAWYSLLLAMLPCLEGFLGTLGVFPTVSPIARNIWRSSFFSTMLFGASFYYILTIIAKYWFKPIEWLIRRSLQQTGPLQRIFVVLFAGGSLTFAVDTFYKRFTGQLEDSIEQRREFYKQQKQKTNEKLNARGFPFSVEEK